MCVSIQKGKEKHYDIIVIASLGCVLIAGMWGGLVLNIYRKLRQDRKDLLELKVRRKSCYYLTCRAIIWSVAS